MNAPWVGPGVVAAIGLGYWLLDRHARRGSPPLVRVAPAAWVRVAEAILLLPAGLGAVLLLALVPSVPGLSVGDAATSSLTILLAIAGLRVVFRSAELTATERGIRVFVFRIAWRDVEAVEVGERSVRFSAPQRHRGIRRIELPISDLGWKVDRDVAERLRALHRRAGRDGERGMTVRRPVARAMGRVVPVPGARRRARGPSRGGPRTAAPGFDR